MNIYQLDAGGYWTGAIAEINEDQGAPAGWVLSPPPELGAGEYAAWSGRWSVTTRPWTFSRGGDKALRASGTDQT